LTETNVKCVTKPNDPAVSGDVEHRQQAGEGASHMVGA
jgi:hypothetical protein